MNVIVAAHDLPPARLEALHVDLVAATGQRVEVVSAPGGSSWMAAVRQDHTVLTTSSGPVWSVAVLGSGGRRGADDEGPASTLAATLAGGGSANAPDETLALAIEGGPNCTPGGRIVASVGDGVHRLFVARPVDGGIIVSSNLGLLARLLGPETGADRSMEDFLLGYGFLPDDRTVYTGIRTLGPGVHWLVGDGGQAASTATTDAGGRRVESLAAAADELHEVFMEVMDDLAGPRHGVAVMMGGLDSALVAASLVRLGRQVTTYTFGFDDPAFNQRNVALVTEAIGSTERWVPITPEVIMDGLREFGEVFAQPGPQPHYQIHTLHASRAIRADGFDSVLTGDGCDAVFLGYPTVSTRARLLRNLGHAPRPAVDAAMRGASMRLADRRLGHAGRMVRSTLGNLQLPMPERGHLPTRYLDDVALGRLRRGPAPAQDETVVETRRRLARELGGLDPVRLAFHGNAATGQSRMKVDGCVTSTGLRQYSPFLHPRLRSFVAELPLDYLRPSDAPGGSAGKVVLVEMVRRHGLLPEAVIGMAKQSPATSPVDQWYAGPLRSEVLALLEHLPFEWDRGFIDEVLRPKFIERQYRDRIALGHHTFQVIGLLASYASFHRR